MSTSTRLSPAEIRAKSEAWYEHQLRILGECHGREWPKNREWIEGYLKEQLRQRLIAQGWRPKA